MSLIVQKFGGTSVGSIERIQQVAARILKTKMQGHEVLSVVSAMAGETNRLVALAKQIAPHPDSKEYDLLIASGEQISVGLLSLALNQLKPGCARPFLGYQLGILTDNVYSKARIQAIDTHLLRETLDAGLIPVIAGFQGVDAEKNITTLGRGGSDTSAVAIAAAIKADVCEILTDVDGIYTTDPRLLAGTSQKAKMMEQVSYEEMMELASLGAKVLQIRSVELAAKFSVPLHVRSSFHEREGTWVVPANQLGSKMEQVVVAGVASDLSQLKITLQNIPDVPGAAAKIFGSLSKAAVVVDVIVQNQSLSGTPEIAFTIGEADAARARQALNDLKKNEFQKLTLHEEPGLAKVSIVGVGMQHHPGVAAKMFQVLAEQAINIRLISTSEIKVSCLFDQKKATLAVQALHKAFGLDAE